MAASEMYAHWLGSRIHFIIVTTHHQHIHFRRLLPRQHQQSKMLQFALLLLLMNMLAQNPCRAHELQNLSNMLQVNIWLRLGKASKAFVRGPCRSLASPLQRPLRLTDLSQAPTSLFHSRTGSLEPLTGCPQALRALAGLEAPHSRSKARQPSKVQLPCTSQFGVGKPYQHDCTSIREQSSMLGTTMGGFHMRGLKPKVTKP